MGLFAPENRTRTPRNQRLYAAMELARTALDAVAALLFLTGSIMFFHEDFHVLARWFFIIGSFLFATRPVLRVLGEIQLLAKGDIDGLADRERR
jgi:hypothetical protein